MNSITATDKNEIKFLYSVLFIFIFFVVAVIPAMSYDEKIISTIDQINNKGIASLNNNEKFFIEKNNQAVTLVFKTPDYVFLFLKLGITFV